MAERRALVTGGAGFIGAHLVEGLVRAGWRVRVLDDYSSGCEAHLADVSVLEAARRAGVRRVVYAGSTSVYGVAPTLYGDGCLERARSLLGYAPRVSLAEGLRRPLAHFGKEVSRS